MEKQPKENQNSLESEAGRKEEKITLYVTADGQQNKLEVSTETLARFRQIAESKGKNYADFLRELVDKYGFSENIMQKAVDNPDIETGKSVK